MLQDSRTGNCEPTARSSRPSGARRARGGAGLLFRRYAQFCLVGGSGVIVDMGILWMLASPSMLGWNLTVSKVLAAEAALINNFVWNELWTFRELTAGRTRWRERFGRFLKFNLICVAGIGLSMAMLNLQVHGFGMNVYLSNLIAIVGVSLWNFGLNLKFGWNTGTSELPEAAAAGRQEPR